MRQDRVALLIDADNVSLDVIEQAVAWVAKHYGGPHLRRAYCTPESAVKHQTAFKRLSVRPMVNLAAGKNSTDIALAVDAIEIAAYEQPDVIVIASSDSDFAPVVARLRERGCRVVGLGQQGKVGQETQGIYDDYEVFEHRGGSDDGAPVPRKRAARGGTRGTRGGTSGASKRATKTEAPTKTAATGRSRVVEAVAQAPEPEVFAPKASVAEKPAAKAAKSTRTSRAKVAPAPTTEVEDTAPEAAAPAKTRARKTTAKKTAARKTAIDDAAPSIDAPMPEAVAPPAKKTRARKSTKVAAPAPRDVGDMELEATHEVEVAPTPARPVARTAMVDRAPSQPSDPSDRSGGTPRHVDLDAVLRALPELAKGTTLNLNDVGQRLRAAKLLSKSGSSIKLLRQFREIRLEPAGQPSRVRLV